MLTPKIKAKEFAKYGFKRCKGIPRDSECYYLCVARGCKMIFVSDICFDIIDWEKDDSRIRKAAVSAGRYPVCPGNIYSSSSSRFLV